MIISKYLQTLFFLLMMGGALCTLQACGDDEEDEPVQKPNEEETVKPDDGKEEEKPSDKPSDTMEAVDLGLPSGTLWATCNVGASSPEEYGGYYAWGETEEKVTYTIGTYKNYDANAGYINIGSNITSTQYDVANVEWGGSWRMPTRDEIQELYKCSWEWTTLNGVSGQLVTGPNGNSIFFPAAGGRNGAVLEEVNTCGIYWSSTLYESYTNNAYCLLFSNIGTNSPRNERVFGFTIRPVKSGTPKTEEGKDYTGIIDGFKYVDLGLSVKWATCNVGASYPDERGNYYAWGETETKDIHIWENYKWANGTNYDVNKYCATDNCMVLKSSDDVATVKWGSKWRMPTVDEFKELVENCTWEWTKVEDSKGYKVKSPNGNSIFLPAAGYSADIGDTFQGKFGYYWSASLSNSYSYYAYSLCFQEGTWRWGDNKYRSIGLSIRPVCD